MRAIVAALLVSVALFCVDASARSKEKQSLLATQLKTPAQVATSPWMGATFGFVGLGTNVAGNFLGMSYLFGGDFFVRLPVAPNYFFKPSVGVYYGQQGAGSVGVGQSLTEVSAALLYVPDLSSQTRSQIGFTVKADLALSQINTPNQSAITAPSFGARLGPVAGVAYSVSHNTTWITDLEITTPVQVPLRPYIGLLTGLMYRWE